MEARPRPRLLGSEHRPRRRGRARNGRRRLRSRDDVHDGAGVGQRDERRRPVHDAGARAGVLRAERAEYADADAPFDLSLAIAVDQAKLTLAQPLTVDVDTDSAVAIDFPGRAPVALAAGRPPLRDRRPDRGDDRDRRLAADGVRPAPLLAHRLRGRRPRVQRLPRPDPGERTARPRRGRRGAGRLYSVLDRHAPRARAPRYVLELRPGQRNPVAGRLPSAVALAQLALEHLARSACAAARRRTRPSAGACSRRAARARTRSARRRRRRAPGRGTTSALTVSPQRSSGTPITATSATAGCCASASSTSTG